MTTRMMFRMVVTDLENGNTIVHEGDLATIFNHVDLYAAFELTVSEIHRAVANAEVLVLNPYTTAVITRIV